MAALGRIENIKPKQELERWKISNRGSSWNNGKYQTEAEAGTMENIKCGSTWKNGKYQAKAEARTMENIKLRQQLE